ncbi:MAG: UTP--glucose-1-phosphate uridylyltransferase [Propionibacteriaceae bacterium]|nr:UTP--glucose-1-phosphate uridylyltransferase [Propionibacteriaceae bacterium]
MRAAGVNPTACSIFAHYYAELASGSTGLIPERQIEPEDQPERVDDQAEQPGDRQALAQTVVIRLNGGLGTSMGLDRAKSLLPVRDGLTFLDLIARQVQHVRRTYQVRLPLVFLHSFNTRADCLAALAAYPDLAVGDLPLDMVQSQEPKLLRADLHPVEWPANRRLEWCPPGHGDLYPTLLDSGLLDRLIAAGMRYASVSNSDNLGCAPSPALAGWFARSGAPFAAEVTLRTEMDLKGGHLARRRSDGRLILRESAQTPAQDMVHFTDAAVHPYTHCNNLWFDLPALKAKLAATGGVLRLPLIRNAKTVDPNDPASPAVYQIESAMGAAIEVFEGAAAVAVSRRRFLPVKTTNELALLRSDVYSLGPDHIPLARTSDLPVLSLDKTYYGRLADFEARLPFPLRLADSASLTVEGDWRFGADVQVAGRVRLSGSGTVPDGTWLEGD